MSTQAPDNTWSDYVALLRRRWRPTFVVTASIALGTIYLAYSLPAVYQSSTTILIEDQGIPTDMVQTTIDSYAEQRLQTLYQRVTVSQLVLQMIDEFDLYNKDRGTLPDQELIELFRDNTEMVPQNVESVNARTGREAIITYGFTISFSDSNPLTARNVAQELADRFVSENSVLRQEMAERTTKFLDSEAEGIEQMLASLAARIADFKESNTGNLPEDQAANMVAWERSKAELTKVESDLRAARETKSLLESEMIDTPRYRPVLDESGEPILGGIERLSEAQQELVRLRGRYSDNHPDIINLQREIAALSASPENRAGLAEQIREDLTVRRKELSTARARYSDDHPDVIRLERSVAALEDQLASIDATTLAQARPNNPAYLQLQTRISTLEAEVYDLSNRRGRLVSRIDELERRRIRAPQIERQFSELEQERELLIERYRDLRGLGSEAALGRALEAGQSGERLAIVERARVPSSPVSPNRISLSFLGIVFAIAAGLGLAGLADAMDTKVRGRQDVYHLLDAPPIGIIPYVENKGDTLRRIGLNVGTGIVTLAAVAVVVRAVVNG